MSYLEKQKLRKINNVIEKKYKDYEGKIVRFSTKNLRLLNMLLLEMIKNNNYSY